MSNSPGDREFPLLLRFSFNMKLGHKLQSSNSHTAERVENNCFKGNHHECLVWWRMLFKFYRVIINRGLCDMPCIPPAITTSKILFSHISYPNWSKKCLPCHYWPQVFPPLFKSQYEILPLWSLWHSKVGFIIFSSRGRPSNLTHFWHFDIIIIDRCLHFQGWLKNNLR